MQSIVPPDENQTVNNTNEIDPDTLAQVRSGANWFYWIAGLSLINSAIFLFGGEISFILGLAVTQVIDGLVGAAIAEGAPGGLKVIAVGLDLVVAFIFVLFGYFSNKGLALAFIIGSIIYIFDGLIYLAVGDMLAAGFHVFALFFIIRGFLASRRLANFQAANQQQTASIW